MRRRDPRSDAEWLNRSIHLDHTNAIRCPVGKHNTISVCYASIDGERLTETRRSGVLGDDPGRRDAADPVVPLGEPDIAILTDIRGGRNAVRAGTRCGDRVFGDGAMAGAHAAELRTQILRTERTEDSGIAGHHRADDGNGEEGSAGAGMERGHEFRNYSDPECNRSNS